jgi:hypothetical protein
MAGAWADPYERLMNITAVFVDIGTWATVPSVFVVKLEFGKQAKVIARVEIEMGHHPVHDVSVLALRPSAEHPVFVILVFDPVFESHREPQIRVLTEQNVLRQIEEVCALRRVREKTPILLCRKWIQRRPFRIWSRTRWLRIRRLCPRS